MTSPTNSAIAAVAKVQRYDLVEHGSYYSEGSIDPVENGEYVLHSDYAALLAKLAEVEADRDMLRGLYRGAAADLASALLAAMGGRERDFTSERLRIAVEALERLSRLGNEPHLGNSDGNCIAIDALEKIGPLPPPPTTTSTSEGEKHEEA